MAYIWILMIAVFITAMTKSSSKKSRENLCDKCQNAYEGDQESICDSCKDGNCYRPKEWGENEHEEDT